MNTKPSVSISRISESVLFPTIIGLTVVTLGFWRLGLTAGDDPFISFGAAEQLTRTGLHNISGDRVEQSTSLLWILLLAAISDVAHVDVATTGFLLSGVMFVLSSVLIARNLETKSWQISTLGTLLVLSIPAYLFWSLSGMEFTLALAILLAIAPAIGGKKMNPQVLGILAVMLFLARPDVGISAIAAWILTIGIQMSTGHVPKNSSTGLKIAMLGLVLAAAFRKLWFSAWLPEPVGAKVGRQSLVGWREGVEYAMSLLQNPRYIGPLSIVVTLLIFAQKRIRLNDISSVSFLFIFAFGNAMGVILSGGDWMLEGRLLVPSLVAFYTASLRLLLLNFDAGLGIALMLVIVGQFAALPSLEKLSFGAPVGDEWRAEINGSLSDIDFTWYERRNRIYLRDAVFVAETDAIVYALHSEHLSLSIGSGQAGKVVSSIAGKYDGIRFIDLHGLATRDFQQCSDVKSSRVGLAVTYEF